MAHSDLLSHWHKRFGESVEVLGDTGDGDHNVVDVGEGQGALCLVFVFCGEEGGWVGFPVAARVEVVGGVVAVVETVTVGLRGDVSFKVR